MMATSWASGSLVSRARMTRPYVPLPRMPSCMAGTAAYRADCRSARVWLSTEWQCMGMPAPRGGAAAITWRRPASACAPAPHLHIPPQLLYSWFRLHPAVVGRQAEGAQEGVWRGT